MGDQGIGAPGTESKLLPKLYTIIDRGTLDARGVQVRAFAEELREGGARLVQYRDKKNGAEEVLRACEEVHDIFAGTDAKLLVNDHVAIAARLGWGVHLGQGDVAVPEAAALVATIGVSTHTEEQVRVADGSAARYVATGPVFGTRTKLDAEVPVGLEGVRRARALTRKPLVAIGGITLETCCAVVEAGADSVAVISGLFVEGRAVREVVRDFLERMG